MANEEENKFAKYEQLLGVVFGAAFGAIGSISMPPAETLAAWLMTVLYLIVAAVLSIWAILLFALISRVIARGERVKTSAYLTSFVFLVCACIIIYFLSVRAAAVGVTGNGSVLSAILVSWAVTYLMAALWVRVQAKLV
jgi:hypothetical protein